MACRGLGKMHADHQRAAVAVLVDEGLARFRYAFPDGAEYHLNMFPLRKAYTRQLLKEVGFQKIKTYGDFQESHQEPDPDFFVHVAEKNYHE